MNAFNALILLFFLGISLEYTPDSLYEYYKNTYSINPAYSATASKIIDPDKYIKKKDVMLKKINQIEAERHLRLLFVVIEKMDFFYTFRIDAIGHFGDTFTELFYSNNTALIDDSLTIVYSIKDRKMRISTGKNVRAVYDDYTCLCLLENEKGWLRFGYYEYHFNKLLDNILNIDQVKEEIRKWTPWGYFLAFLILGIVALCVCWCSCERKEIKVYATPEERDKLEKINKLLDKMDNYKNREKEIFADHCIICLEEFSDPSKQDTALNVKEDQKEGEDKPEEPLIEMEEPANSKTTLECGHQFHKGCIAKWLLKNSKCPICREEFKDIHSEDEFRKKVVNVQYTFNPHINISGLAFINGRYAYFRTVYNYEFTGASSSHSYFRRGGGASSGW